MEACSLTLPFLLQIFLLWESRKNKKTPRAGAAAPMPTGMNTPLVQRFTEACDILKVRGLVCSTAIGYQETLVATLEL
jgi:hypothetical protein